MVERFRLILDEIVRQKGPVRLFAILKMDELTDKWTVILSAPWVIESTLRDDFIFLRNLMIVKFNNEEMATVARLGIFTKDEHIIEELLKYKEGSVIEGDEKINGSVVHEAYILASDSSV